MVHQYQKGRHTYSFFPTWKERDPPPHCTNRHAETYYMRCSFTQNDTRASRHAIEPRISPLCPHCNTNETVDHIFIVCPKYQPARQTLRNSLSKLPNPLPLTTKLLIANLSIKHLVEKFISTSILKSSLTVEDQL